MDTSMKEFSDYVRNQAFTAFPFLKVILRLDQDFCTILHTIDNCERIIPVLTTKLGIPRRSLHRLGTHTVTISKVLGKFPLPSHRIKNTLELKYFDKSEAFIRFIKVLPFITPDHQPENENDYFELVKIMRLIYSYWILTEDVCDPLEQVSMNGLIYPWICARAWTHIQKRPLKRSFSIPAVNPFIIRHLRAWRDAVREQQPGEMFIGALSGKHHLKNLSPLKLYAPQWALISLLDRHPADLQKLLDNWPNKARDALVEKLRKYSHVTIAMKDQFTVELYGGKITIKKMTTLGALLEDSILARNCMADYGHILLRKENMDVWRIYDGDRKNLLVGHVMRCHKNGTLLTEGHFIGNKPLPPKLSGAIVKLLQHRDFDAGPRDSTALYQSIESISHRARIQALSGCAKAMIVGALQKFGLEKVLETDIAQLEQAIEFFPAARKLAQQINNFRVTFPCLLQNSQSQSDIWGLMTVILSNDDIPTEIISGIESKNHYRKSELIAAALSSVSCEFHLKYAMLKSELTEFQVDALIQAMTEGNRKMAAHCTKRDFIALNTMACVHLVLLCHIFFDNLQEKDEQILLSNISCSMKERAQKKFPTHEFPQLSETNEARTSFFLYYDYLNSSSKYILDAICNLPPNDSAHLT